jgi:hypothetical protein
VLAVNFANLLGHRVNPDFLNAVNFKAFQSIGIPSYYDGRKGCMLSERYSDA